MHLNPKRFLGIIDIGDKGRKDFCFSGDGGSNNGGGGGGGSVYFEILFNFDFMYKY